MAKWQRRHYETVAAGLRAKKASASEVEAWVNKFKADNPGFNTAIFLAAVQGGTVSRRGVEREYRPVSKPRRAFKIPSLSGYRTKSGRCKFGKKRSHGRWVCRRSRRK